MKNLMKISLLGAALVAFTGMASATTIQCTPGNQNVITNSINVGPVVAACNGITATSGTHITSWGIALIGTFQDAVVNGGHQLQFSATNNVTAAVVSGNTGIDDFVGSTGFVAGAQLAAFLTALPNITVTASVAGLGGLLLPDNASVTVFVVTTETPDTTGTPEPVTMSLMGAGLLALGFAGRKLRRS